MTTATVTPQNFMKTGQNPMLQTAAYLHLGQVLLWAFLFFRWLTFSGFDWSPFAVELALAEWPPLVAYIIYGVLAVVDVAIGIGLLRNQKWAIQAGVIKSAIVILVTVYYFLIVRDLYGAAMVMALAGFALVLLARSAPWSLAFPA
ncbi:MAG: hypothetical protein R3264_22715, partial [Anaerolineae bacterium]|nr:hypothetical protein [Anaerolineae bacterium]